MSYTELGVILSVPLRKPVNGPLRDFPELAPPPVTIAIQREKWKRRRVRRRKRRWRGERGRGAKKTILSESM